MFIVSANDNFDIDSFCIKKILTYEPNLYFEVMFLHFVRRYCDAIVKPHVNKNFGLNINTQENRNIRKHILAHVTERLKNSKESYTGDELISSKFLKTRKKQSVTKVIRKELYHTYLR